jgi:DNA-binding XRE family transcriptional regulator
MSAQFIEIEGKQVVIIPADDYRVLLEKAEMLDDVAAYDRAKDALAAGDDELVPAVVANAILDGESPVRVWRQHREMSQVQLAEATGISQAYLAQIETGKREGTLTLYRSLADALGIDLDDLVG